MAFINKQDTDGNKGLLDKGELGYDDYQDKGRVYVGDGTSNVALAKENEVTDARAHEALVDFSRVDSYVKEDGTRWLKNNGSGADGEMLSGQMLEFDYGTTKVSINSIDFSNTSINFSFRLDMFFKVNSLIIMQINDTNAKVRVVTTADKIRIYLKDNELAYITNKTYTNGDFISLWVTTTGTTTKAYDNGIELVLDTDSYFSNMSGDLLCDGILGNFCYLKNYIATADDIALDYAQPELLCGVSTNTIQSPFSFDTDDILCHFPLQEGTMAGGSVWDIKNTNQSPLLLNDDFSSDSNWVINDANYNISGGTFNGTAYSTAGADYILPSTTNELRITFDAISIATNELRILAYRTDGSTQIIVQTPVGTTGTVSYDIKNSSTAKFEKIRVYFSIFTIDNMVIEDLSGVYPIENYDSTMWTNADNLPYGIQQTLLVKDDVSNFVTGISKYAVDSVTALGTPTLSTYWSLSTNNDAVISAQTTDSFTITSSTASTSTNYPAINGSWNSDVTIQSNKLYRVSFDYNTNGSDVKFKRLFLPNGNERTPYLDRTVNGIGTLSYYVFSSTEKVLDSNEWVLSIDGTTTYSFTLDVSNFKFEEIGYKDLSELNSNFTGKIIANETIYDNGEFKGLTLSTIVKLPSTVLRNTNSYIIGGSELGMFVYHNQTKPYLNIDGTSKDIEIGADTYAHIVISVDSSGNGIRYINGVAFNRIGVTMDEVANQFAVGETSTGTPVNADINLSNVQWFRKSLTQFEVNELYNNIKTNAPTLSLP